MDKVLEALNTIPVADLDRADWLHIGMSLKHEGYRVSVWDRWSRPDPDRYHDGECERTWAGFHGSDKPRTRRTIFYIASKYGWRDKGEGLAWDGTLD